MGEDFDKRPWGNYRVLCREKGFQVKRIEIKPGARFSLQKHSRRDEKWTMVSGVGVVTIQGKEMFVQKGSVIDVPRETVHRMENTGKEPLVFIEVQLGDYLGEDDITRLEDDFGRA